MAQTSRITTPASNHPKIQITAQQFPGMPQHLKILFIHGIFWTSLKENASNSPLTQMPRFSIKFGVPQSANAN
jgi:hypothetical protein